MSFRYSSRVSFIFLALALLWNLRNVYENSFGTSARIILRSNTALGDLKKNWSVPTDHEDTTKNANRNKTIIEASLIEDATNSNFLPRVLALLFPQFHQDPLNDRLWGKGFSDWDNLKNAPVKNRLGFSIPRPTELGYYDLTNVEPRKKQGELAKQYGIDGFVFHHYWFNDPQHPGPNLHVPLLKMLKDGHPDVPFALHWCAMKWTSTWSGNVAPDFVFQEPGVLQKQYFPEDENSPNITAHYNFLRQFFHHPNYIKVDGKPFFMMYQKKPSAVLVLRRLRQLAIQDGFPGLYLTVGLTKAHGHLLNVDDNDLTKQFERLTGRTLGMKNLYNKVVSYPNPAEWAKGRSLEVPSWCLKPNANTNASDDGNHQHSDNKAKKRLRDIAGIISSFDNTPRRNYKDANLFAADDHPEVLVERFRRSLHSAIYYEACCFPDRKDRMRKERKDDDRFVLINAMNEWAEGMVLEPSDVYGRKFLETIRDTKLKIMKEGCSL